MSASKSLNDILTTKHIDSIVKKATGEDSYQLLSEEVRPAAEGVIGHLGDHYRIALRVRLSRGIRTLQLFVKTLPMANQGKQEFVVSGNFFRREALMFQLFEDLGGDDGPNPWHPKAYLSTDTFVAMPDLSFEGYSCRPVCQYADRPHAMITAASIARFHAAFATYDTAKASNGNDNSFFQKYRDLFKEITFSDSPWLRAAAIVTSSIAKTYSKHKDIPNLDEKMVKLFIEACDTMKVCDETLNVIVHRDLWSNNVLYRYEDDVPVDAVIVDFQCLQYGPPAFDMAVFLYLQTSREFREAHEKEVCMHYYKIFMESVDAATRRRLEKLGYSFEGFLSWLERAREYSLVVALSILPYVLMEPLTSRRVYDDPATFEELKRDRSRPVLEYCRQDAHFRDCQVELAEEFIERYVVNVA